MSKRYYVHNLDSYFGQAIYRQLYQPTEDGGEGDNVIIGVYTDPDRADKLSGVKKIMKRSKPKLYRKYLVESDVVIYDLHFGNINEVEFAIDAYKKRAAYEPFEEPKTLVLVSSCMVWDDTPRKIKPKEEKKDDDDDGAGGDGGDAAAPQNDQPQANQDAPADDKSANSQDIADIDDVGDGQAQDGADGQDQPPVEEIKKEDPPVYEAFKEEDYPTRTPSENYIRLKELEDLVLSLKIENLKTYVICPGIFYGKGEVALKQHLKAAWLQSPKHLPYLGDGENLIPTIHIDDLAKFVLKVVDAQPENQYHFALDITQERKQKNLIAAIAKNMGADKIEGYETIEGTIIPPEFEPVFWLDLDLRPSPLLFDEENEPDFEWTAKNGIPQNMEIIRNQFCEAEKLRPIKIVAYEEPGAHMKQSTQKLAEHYNIPRINLRDTIVEILEGNCNDPDLIVDVQELSLSIEEFFLADKYKEKPLDEGTKTIFRAIRWRLNQNDCRNRGFILEDFPLHKSEAEYIYVKKLLKKLKRKKPKQKKKAQAQNPDVSNQSMQQDPDTSKISNVDDPPADNQDPDADDPDAGDDDDQQDNDGDQQDNDQDDDDENAPKFEAFFPESIIHFKGNPSFGHQLNEQEDQFREYLKQTKVRDFFYENQIDVYIFDPTNKADAYESFESLRLYIEKNGRPNNYIETFEELANQHKNYYQHKHQKYVEKNEQRKQKEIIQQEEIVTARNQIAKGELKFIFESEKPHFVEKDIPFRQYLKEYVMPTLSEGLMEISNLLPDDPVEYLAEYLYDKSFEIGKKLELEEQSKQDAKHHSHHH